MGYESLSSVVLVAIAALLMFVWAPRKARKGMKRASEHRSDRFSASLHLVDESGVTRFNDTTPPITKGLLMQAEQQRKASRLTPQRIARVRELRRAAIRRRRIVVCALFVATVVVLALALTLRFSPLFALIPFVLMVTVLGFGARASAQARAWEAEVAAVAKRGAGASQILPQTVGKAARPVSAAAKSNKPVKSAKPAQSAAAAQPAAKPSAGADTDVMMTSEIRAVLDQARAEQAVAKAERAAARADAARADAARAAAESASAAAPAQNAQNAQSAQSAEPDPAADAADVARQAAAVAAEPSDATNELQRISPSHVLDAFELASSQDLISFTLGAPRSGKPVAQAEPESMEIKSTRQVAKAVPPEPQQQSQAQEAQTVQSAGQTPESITLAAPAAEPVEVEAPEVSAESLGVDVDAVIARRGH